jgi:hypothetical protein
MFGTLFLIGVLTYLPPGDVTMQATTPSHQNRRKFQALFSNSSYTKREFHDFHNFTVLFQPHSVEIYSELQKYWDSDTFCFGSVLQHIGFELIQ